MDGGSFGEINAALCDAGGPIGMTCLVVVPSDRAHTAGAVLIFA
jgi:hypothetical protein